MDSDQVYQVYTWIVIRCILSSTSQILLPWGTAPLAPSSAPLISPMRWSMLLMLLKSVQNLSIKWNSPGENFRYLRRRWTLETSATRTCRLASSSGSRFEKPDNLGDAIGPNITSQIEKRKLPEGLIRFWGTLEIFRPYYDQSALEFITDSNLIEVSDLRYCYAPCSDCVSQGERGRGKTRGVSGDC